MIIVRLSGGMGNQMFQYAVGRSLSLKHSVPLALDLTFLKHRIKMPKFLRPHFVFREFSLDVFNIQAEIATAKDIKFWNRPLFGGRIMLLVDALLRKLSLFPGWEKSFTFDSRVLALGPDAYLEGFWQSEKYFSEFSSRVRQDFALKSPLPDDAKKLLEEIRKTESLCVHIRRGDKALNSFDGTCDLEYYRRGLAYVVKHKSIEKIYVFSDDIKWSEENINFPLPTIFVSGEYAGKKGEGHLALMQGCKNFIIANSTFSWWAAWLAENPDKIVIAPQKWFATEKINPKI